MTLDLSDLKIEHIHLVDLEPAKRSARTHSRHQLRKLADSIGEFGFVCPVLIDEGGQVLAGNARVAAAKLLGLETAPCVRVNHMSEAQKRAYVIADNRLAELAGWDEEILAEEFDALIALDPGFDLSITGFELGEIDGLIEGCDLQVDEDPAADAAPARETVATRCQPGDIWSLGPHRLICGDALDPEVVERLMDGRLARMVFTDPPYNVPIDGHVSGLGKVRHEDFAMACGEMDAQQFTGFLETALGNHARHSRDGSIHFVCMDWRHLCELRAAGDAVYAVYAELKNLIVWDKGSGGMGSFYRSQHELIFAFKKGAGAHVNTFGLGQNGRYRTNVWRYRGVNAFGADRDAALAMHPTVKPVQMIADAMRDVSGRGDIVLDLFGGSGSTLIAAHKTGRRACLCELDPGYCDVILARWEAYAKDRAERVSSCEPRLGDAA